MKVILLADIPKLGKKYDVKEVSGGHARNFLIPKKLAEIATPGALKHAEVLRAAWQKEHEAREVELAKLVEGLEGRTITLERPANEEGHLFAGIHPEDLSLPGGTETEGLPVKAIGTHAIIVIGGGKKSQLTLEIRRAPSA